MVLLLDLDLTAGAEDEYLALTVLRNSEQLAVLGEAREAAIAGQAEAVAALQVLLVQNRKARRVVVAEHHDKLSVRGELHFVELLLELHSLY